MALTVNNEGEEVDPDPDDCDRYLAKDTLNERGRSGSKNGTEEDAEDGDERLGDDDSEGVGVCEEIYGVKVIGNNTDNVIHSGDS